MQSAKRALLVYMRHLSEDIWCASWLIDLEFTLWDWVLRWRSGAEPVSKFEQTSIPDIEVLSWLAEQAGGWWCWDKESREPKFVALNGWMEMCRNQPESDIREPLKIRFFTPHTEQHALRPSPLRG